MQLVTSVLTVIALVLLSPAAFFAQSSQPSGSVSVPRLINLSGVFRPADGQPHAPVETVTLAIYADQEGGTPLWQETQSVALDDAGRYALLLGATHAEGVPREVFASGEAQWLGMVFARVGEVEGPRVRITSVPYALRASDAETLGGRPASSYLLAPTGGASDGGAASAAAGQVEVATAAAVLPGTTNFLAKYVNSADVGNSAVFETGGAVGIGTTTPLDTFHVRFTNTNGGATGLAVQNLGNTATSFSGMLFYDQNGALGQFQGFNNVTHEYRINNIASTGGVFNGSINFMTGSTSRFFVATGGNIGIGTASPAFSLDVTNALSTNPTTNIVGTSYSNTGSGTGFVGRKSRGTASVPTAVQSNDLLSNFGAQGYGATAFSADLMGTIGIRASENWTDAAQGTQINFNTTANGSTAPATRMIIGASGNVGIGGTPTAAALEVIRTGESVVLNTTSAGEPQFLTRASRSSGGSPSAVQDGDVLGVFGSGGFGSTGFYPLSGGMAVRAAQNWTDAAHGAALTFATTPLGQVDPETTMAFLPNGNVGIGTPAGVNGIPTAADKLQVFGDLRVGTTGTNGCLKNFAGTGLIGTCASDLRFKKDITPFGATLGSLSALRPVHYFWRADEFPNKHFGDSAAYGLIAQEVEQVLPELVVTGADGYKAVDYSKLPLLTIQAVKELKSENDALKQRVAELERLMTELAAMARRH